MPRRILPFLLALGVSVLPVALDAQQPAPVVEGRIAVGAASLYTRVTGRGTPVIVLHGGPDFDLGYMLPELDRLADRYTLHYYDQRGRGKSAANVRPEELSLATDLEDLDRVRRHFGLDSVVLLGHSWGAVLALEYATRYPAHVSGLILLNPAPVEARVLTDVRRLYLERLGTEMDRQRAIATSPGYQQADPEAVAARYRIHFKPSLYREADYERMMARMRAGFIAQGSQGILTARAVEDRLMTDTWARPEYDLTPQLRNLRVRTLVVAGEHDFMLLAAQRIAAALPNAELVSVPRCGHFAFLECADAFLGRLRP